MRRCLSLIFCLAVAAACQEGPAQPSGAAAVEAPRGVLAKESVKGVIDSHIGAVKACYERALQSARPDLAGKVVAHWTIAADGSVQGASIRDDELGEKSVAECIVKEIGGWHFPAPEGGSVTVNYPFTFAAAP